MKDSVALLVIYNLLKTHSCELCDSPIYALEWNRNCVGFRHKGREFTVSISSREMTESEIEDDKVELVDACGE